MTTETRTLNARRIDAASALADADAHLRGLLARWQERCLAGIAGRPPLPWSAEDDALDARITEAQRERNRAQAAYDSAEHDLAAEITAERAERESAQQWREECVRRWRNDRRALRGLRPVTP